MTEQAKPTEPTDDNLPAIPRFSDDALREIKTFDDAVALLQDAGFSVVDAAETLGSGFMLADDAMKDSLIGVPMALLHWTFNTGEYLDANGQPQEFVTVALVTSEGQDSNGNPISRKIIVNDGSTGIRDQLRDYTDRTSRHNGLLVKRGLRKSTYRIGTVNGQKQAVPKTFDGATEPASTYYLDTSG